MTRLFYFGLLTLCAVAWVGCTDTSDGEPATDQRTAVLENQLHQLQQRNADLEEEARLSQDVLHEYTQVINETLSDLEAITAREDMLRAIRLDIENTESEEDLGPTIRDRINENLAAIDAHIRSSKRRRIAFDQALKDTLAALDHAGNVAELQQSIAGLEITVRQLNELVDQKEQTIEDLRAEAENMLVRITDLSEENTDLVEENTELREAYYVIGTRDELLEQGIIDRRGGFLSIGKETQIGDLSVEKFNRVDFDAEELFVGAHLKGYRILSDHKMGDQWYEFGSRNRETHLSIYNPEAFWKISRFLIIEVER